MKINLFIKLSVLSLAIVLLASCDKDYNEIGSDIVGGDNDHYNFENTTFPVVAYNQNTGVVATNNLPINLLGIYNHPVFGKTTASFVTQLELASQNPTFINPENPGFEIDSVYLYVPYFSNIEDTDSETGDKTYTLDSVYNQEKSIKLSVYESGYYLRDYDPSTSFQETQKYYSNQNNDVDAVKIGSRLNNAESAQNDNFKFSKDEVKINYVDEETNEIKLKERKTPGILLNLDNAFFEQKILNAPSGKLLNNNTFKEYFRGLYFKVEESSENPGDGALNKIDFSKGTITIRYHDETSSISDELISKTLTINLSGNSVNFFENNYNANYTSAISNPNTTLGDEKLYLKGGEGSMAIIELFNNIDVDNNGISDQIDEIKANGWLINEANLTFTIDKDALNNAPEPNRIYLYDLQNRRPLYDYYTDASRFPSDSKRDKSIHGGYIVREDVEDDNSRGIKYKIRITQHVRNLVKNDSTNVKLGLVVSESINNVLNASLKNPINSRLDRIPVANTINPLGTILYGSNNSVPEDKKLKLEIYYTKPD